MPEKLSPQQGLKIEEFTQNLYSCPYAILITRLSDGLILYANRGFEEIFGYPSSEAAGKTILDLRLWVKDADRQQVVSELSTTGEVQSKKYQFRKNSEGEELTGLFSPKSSTSKMSGSSSPASAISPCASQMIRRSLAWRASRPKTPNPSCASAGTDACFSPTRRLSSS